MSPELLAKTAASWWVPPKKATNINHTPIHTNSIQFRHVRGLTGWWDGQLQKEKKHVHPGSGTWTRLGRFSVLGVVLRFHVDLFQGVLNSRPLNGRKGIPFFYFRTPSDSINLGNPPKETR